MNLPGFCIRRPVFTIVISLVMMIVGLIGFINLPVRWIPNINPPLVTIMTEYPGASAHLVEHDVTKVIEDALSGISGIDTITSTSRRAESEITVEFKLGRNMDTAVEDVRTAVERVRGDLPLDAETPTVLKANPDDNPIMYISFYDAHRDARELSDYLDKFVIPTFETVDGVGRVGVYGKRLSSIQVRLNPDKMAAANVTVDEVSQLLHDQNASIPSGQIRARDRFYDVITDAGLKTIDQFNNMIIRDQQNQPIRLKDIGEAQIDAEDTDTNFRVNGKAGIALAIIPQSMANPLEIEQRIQKVFAEMQHTLPAGMEAKILYNQADYIRASIHSVYESLIEAIFFVWVVILAFLCRFRATLVPVITIPVCIISTFSILYFLGFSINTITLMAFVLAIGLVVDDAIVMLENISRHIEGGLSAFDAALKGSREIIFPIIAMTLTLAAVYAPIAFTPGLLGILFSEFTFTLAGAVIVSGIVALTLSPMMCARILQSSHQPSGLLSAYQAWLMDKLMLLQNCYQQGLTFLLQKRKWVVGGLLFVATMGALIYYFLPSELAPSEDMNEIDVHLSAPRSASYHYTDIYVRQLEAIYAKIPDIQSYLTINYAAPNSFHILLLKPKKERQHSTQELMGLLSEQANALSGVRANVFTPPPPIIQFAEGDDGDSVGLALMTSSDYDKLQKTSQRLMDAIKQNRGFVHVENNLKWDNEQFQVNINRERAADLKVEVPMIANTISTLIAGKKVGKTEDVNVFVKVNEPSLADPNVFHSIYVRNADNQMIPLGNLVNINESTSPDRFPHFERMRSDMIYLSLAPDFKIAEAVKALRAIAKENLPDDMKYTFTGEAKRFLDSNGKTVFTFILALVFIYLVLAAQFESFIDPFIILLTVPFAVVGAMLTLKLFGGSLNIYSNIGLITLIGLIAKHGILITEFANGLRRRGASIQEAVIEAARLRLRPILMTTAAMVLGALPLAFAFGPGAESRQQIGLVITGGLTFGTFFSLIVVPITYTYLAPFRKLTPITSNQEHDYATVI